MKAKVLVKFKDKYDLKKVYKVGDVIEVTEERFEEILQVGPFVEAVIEKDEEPAEEPAEAVEEPAAKPKTKGKKKKAN